MVLSSEEYRTINELRTDEYRNYLPFDLHNQKNNSTFAVRNQRRAPAFEADTHYFFVRGCFARCSQIFRQQRPGFVAGPLSLVTWARGKSGQHRALRSRK